MRYYQTTVSHVLSLVLSRQIIAQNYLPTMPANCLSTYLSCRPKVAQHCFRGRLKIACLRRVFNLLS